MIIYIDMDNTINELWQTFVNYYNALFDENVTLSYEDLNSPIITRSMKIPLEKESYILNAVFNAKGFWQDIPPSPGAIEVIKELNSIHALFFPTKPWVNCPSCIPSKIAWMQKHFPFIKEDQLIFTHDKSLLKGDVLIDDLYENLRGFDGKKIIKLYPFNNSDSYSLADMRFKCWDWEFFDDINKLISY